MSKVKARIDWNDIPRLMLPDQQPIPTIDLMDTISICTAMIIEPSTDVSEEISHLLYKYRALWEKPRMGTCTTVEHKIVLVDESSLLQEPRKTNDKIDMYIQTQIENLLQHGAIEHSQSPIASPIVVVPKRDGTFRMCIDYRRLNTKTVPDAFPLPPLRTLLTRMRGANYFSTLDLSDAYHLIRVHEQDRYKTAFTTNYGLYQYRVPSFGLINAPATFQRLMNTIIKEIGIIQSSAYLDDIMLFNAERQEHLTNLATTFKILQRYGVYLKIKKCHLKGGKYNTLGSK